MTEDELQSIVTRAMRERGFDTQDHEDKFHSHIPDVSFAYSGVDGWIEFKMLRSRPKLFPRLGRIKAIGQVDWMKTRSAAGGGRCFLLIGVEIPDGLEIGVWHARDVKGCVGKSWTQAVIGSSFSARGPWAPGVLASRMAEGL